ncbi:uncharacterized protein LOC116768731 [Danaus plexippus]|uniref:uncharacterized protein LOC116768731 n=1 Tax=Danaus plexippus TaxID=13037 RepID=UPI002AB17F85|nr:uncharacterized protein LOC116768731 [Danaus plexippus]
MGIKLLLLLGLLIGVLYCLHILAKDYQAIFKPKFFRLTKRNVNTFGENGPTVRWRKILLHDHIQCARYLYCNLGAHSPDNEMQRSFIYMLNLQTKEEDRSAAEEFKAAYLHGKLHVNPKSCNEKYPMCPFQTNLLFELIRYVINKPPISFYVRVT